MPEVLGSRVRSSKALGLLRVLRIQGWRVYGSGLWWIYRGPWETQVSRDVSSKTTGPGNLNSIVA